MSKYMTLSIRANDVPCYGEIEADSLKYCIYKIVEFLHDQTIDGDNHLAYLLDNEHLEMEILEDEGVAILRDRGENTYISLSKEKLFEHAIQKDFRIEKDNYVEKKES